MKKLTALFFAFVLVLTFVSFAEETAAPTVYVTLTDDTGAFALTYAPVTVEDTDADGIYSISDALFCAHVQYHEMGSDAYLALPSEYGISLLMLWNVDNGGSFGYCVNDVSAMSLLDEIHDGDHIKAYAFTDLETWSDTYSYFSAVTAEAKAGEAFALTLYASGYDAYWNPVTLPVEAAVLTVNGEAIEVVTAADGTAEVTFAEAGVYTVSAVSDSMTLVAPLCIVTVS